MPIFVDGAERLPRFLCPGSAARPSLRASLTIGAVPGKTIADLIRASIEGSTTRSNALFDRVAELRGHTKSTGRTLFEGVIAAASRFGPGRDAVEDTISGTLSYRKLLIGARIFAARSRGAPWTLPLSARATLAW